MRKKQNLIVMGISLGMLAGIAAADDNRGFQGRVVGSAVGEHVAGVPSGGAPWVVANSEFNVTANGRIQVEIRGLLISSGAFINTVGPVTMVNASLVCNDVVLATTGAVNLSSGGDASIHDQITVPARCIAPALLIRIAAITAGPVANGPFIAVNALSGNAQAGDDH
ncbi:MAG TPA: hypothetical protein VKT49_17860 [Bryobacteraceae bacterium]|nr:hypothetical protein [Bryobacteraceae bacterium]